MSIARIVGHKEFPYKKLYAETPRTAENFAVLRELYAYIIAADCSERGHTRERKCQYCED